MSVDYISSAFRCSQAPPIARFVLVCLANFADENGYCWPSVGRVSRYCGMDERTVQRSIHHLIEMGELEVVQAGGMIDGKRVSNVYRIKLPLDPRHSATGGTAPPVEGVADCRGTGGTAPPPPVAQRHPNHHKEPSLEPSGKSFVPSAPKTPTKVKAQPQDFEELKAYVMDKRGLEERDAVWLWSKWKGNGFKVNNRPMASWRNVVVAWQAAGYFPSQKETPTRRYA
jgi:hypothetical protein